MFGNELNKSAKLKDIRYHISRSKSDSDKLHYKPLSSKFQSLNKFLEIFHLPETDTVQYCPTSFAEQSNSSLHLNQSQTFNRKTRINYDLRPPPRAVCCLFVSSPFLPVNLLFPQELNRMKLLIDFEWS